MVTARVEAIDRLLGLEMGADDYICNPFSPREVVAWVRAVLRRADNAIGPQPPVPPLTLDKARFEAHLYGRGFDLTPVEFRPLNALASQPGRVFPRDRLMEHLYNDCRVVTDRTGDSHSKKLRRKLEAARLECRSMIRSVYGMGYKLESCSE